MTFFIECARLLYFPLLPLLSIIMLPVLINGDILLEVNIYEYNAYISSPLLYAGKTWAVKADIHDWSELTNTMIRWIISAKVCERIPMSDLGNHMGISSIEDTILLNPIHWFGPLQQMDEDRWPGKFLHFHVNGSHPEGYPKKKWFDIFKLGLTPCKGKEPLQVIELH